MLPLAWLSMSVWGSGLVARSRDLSTRSFGPATEKYRELGTASNMRAFNRSGTLPVYGVNAGIEIQPTSNLSLSFGVGYVQQSGRVDSDINSPALPGASPFSIGGRR